MSKPRHPAFAEFFQWHAIPPTRLHEALQDAAKHEGWTPPWDRQEQEARSAGEQLRNRIAGKKSGSKRADRAELRLLFVKVAFDRLMPTHRMEPFSEHSIDALEANYREVIAEGDNLAAPCDVDILMSAAPFKADRDTLKKDLLRLGIHSKGKKRRSG
jgi:hypothetical protein